MNMEDNGGMILTGDNRRTRRKTCPIATFSTTNPTWVDLDANPRLRGERSATNRLNHGTATLGPKLGASSLIRHWTDSEV
jgi:hypothetical protein